MCGICGILNSDGFEPVSEGLLRAMCGALRHRGPDDEGVCLAGNVGIGMRRLSVIDLEGGRQPQQNEDGTCRIVFNGEIYNYADLRRECEARGHRFSTRSDTETILHLYEDRGADCVHALNGMFAFAIYDVRDRSLTLARDRLGIKPLYYADTGEHFLFASEIKALLRHPAVSREIDPVALDHYLTYKYVPAPRTIFRQVRKLPPASLLVHRDGRFRVRPYWKLSFAKGPDRPDEEVASDLIERLERAVRMQMVSDVPLGVLLSGGIDSSLLVALMSRISDRPVKTFSIGFEERSYNELDSARLVAERFRTDHRELVVRPDVRGLFDRVVGHFDEPFGDSSAVPTFLVSQLARQHVTVALSGTGADEVFAGYERYWAIPLSRAYGRMPRLLRNALARWASHIPTGHAKKALFLRGRRFIESAAGDLLARHRGLVGLFSRAEREALYSPDFRASLPSTVPDPLFERFMDSDAEADLDRLLDVDTATLLADDYLVKDDRMSMAVSLELRVPFLDHTLVEFAAALPPRLKLRGLMTKYILKRAARDILPREILRRSKHGFEMPVACWIAGELRGYVEDLLLSPAACTRGLLDRKAVESLLRAHCSGQSNFSRQIWALLCLERWFRSVPSSDPAPTSETLLAF